MKITIPLRSQSAPICHAAAVEFRLVDEPLHLQRRKQARDGLIFCDRKN
jgi:hypothetical protein